MRNLKKGLVRMKRCVLWVCLPAVLTACAAPEAEQTETIRGILERNCG